MLHCFRTPVGRLCHLKRESYGFSRAESLLAPLPRASHVGPGAVAPAPKAEAVRESGIRIAIARAGSIPVINRLVSLDGILSAESAVVALGRLASLSWSRASRVSATDRQGRDTVQTIVSRVSVCLRGHLQQPGGFTPLFNDHSALGSVAMSLARLRALPVAAHPDFQYLVTAVFDQYIGLMRRNGAVTRSGDPAWCRSASRIAWAAAELNIGAIAEERQGTPGVSYSARLSGSLAPWLQFLLPPVLSFSRDAQKLYSSGSSGHSRITIFHLSPVNDIALLVTGICMESRRLGTVSEQHSRECRESLAAVTTALLPLLSYMSLESIADVLKAVAGQRRQSIRSVADDIRDDSRDPVLSTCAPFAVAVAAHLTRVLHGATAPASTIRSAALVSLLVSFSRSGFRVPQVFSAAAEFLSSVSPQSATSSDSSPEQAELEYRDVGTHALDGDANAGKGRRQSSGAEAVVAVVSTYTVGAIVSVAAAFSQCRYVEWQSDAVRRMWAAIAATFAQRLAHDIRLAGNPTTTPGAGAGGGFLVSPEHAVFLLWSMTRASIASEAITRLVHMRLLQLARQDSPSSSSSLATMRAHFSPASLAHLVWASALQGVYTEGVMLPAFAALAAATLGASDRNAGVLAVRARSQAYGAYLGTRLEAPQPVQERLAAALAVPCEGDSSSAIAAWRAAFVMAQHPQTSALQADVAAAVRDLVAQRWPPGFTVHEELELREGWRVDVCVLPDPKSFPTPDPAFRGVVLEVMGPSHFTRGSTLPPPASQLAGSSGDAVYRFSAPQITPARSSAVDYGALTFPAPLIGATGRPRDSAIASALTLTSASKIRWLRRLDYTVLLVPYTHWNVRWDADEKREVLEAIGLLAP